MIVKENIVEFFKDAVEKSAKKIDMERNPAAEFYLTKMLSEFAKINKRIEEPFAIEYLKNTNSFYKMKLVGDTLLFGLGIFPEKIRKHMSPDYFIGLGSMAYAKSSQLAPKSSAEIFLDLSKNFPDYTLLLMNARSEYDNNRIIFYEFEKFLEESSFLDRKFLEMKGITIDRTYKKIIQ